MARVDVRLYISRRERELFFLKLGAIAADRYLRRQNKKPGSFRVLLVERFEDDPTAARLTPVDFEPTGYRDAWQWAASFNRHEADDSLGVWAVVDRATSAQQKVEKSSSE